MILEQLGDGQINVIDLAAGNGVGTLALFSLICELRSSGLIPKLPPNVHIVGIDYSPDALNYYADLISRLEPWFKQHAINTKLELKTCDLTIPGEFHEAMEEFFFEAKKNGINRFLCTISALTGAQKDGMEAMHNSLTETAKWLSNKNRHSSVLWVEPTVSKGWFERILESFQMTFERIAHIFTRKEQGFQNHSSSPVAITLLDRKFRWLDPYTNAETNSNVAVFTIKTKGKNG